MGRANEMLDVPDVQRWHYLHFTYGQPTADFPLYKLAPSKQEQLPKNKDQPENYFSDERIKYLKYSVLDEDYEEHELQGLPESQNKKSTDVKQEEKPKL